MSSQDNSPAEKQQESLQIIPPLAPALPATLLPETGHATKAITPKRPEQLAEADDARLRQETDTLAGSIVQSAHSRTFFMQIEEIGNEETALVNERISFLEERIHKTSKRLRGVSTEIPTAVGKLRKSLEELHPDPATQSTFGKMLSKVPLMGESLADFWMQSGLREFERQRETTREQIVAIRDSLEANASQLLSDSTELSRMYDIVVANDQLRVQQRAYTMELLVQQLVETARGLSADQERLRGRLQTAVERLTVKVMKLREAEYLMQQGLAATDLTIDAECKVAESLNQTAMVTTSYLPMAQAITQAHGNLARASKAQTAASEGVAEAEALTVDLATKGAAAAAQIYYNPTVTMERHRAAQQKMIQAMEDLEEASHTGMTQATQAIDQFCTMADELRQRQDRLRASRVLTEEPEEESK